MMERRWHARKSVELDVTVCRGSGEVVHGRTRDLSLEGMFIQVLPGAIAYHDPVELRFHGEGPRDGDELRVPALVVRAQSDGVAVMYRNLSSRVQRALLQLVGPRH